ncbi:MAG: DNA repair protein RadC [Rhodospirillales bacterium]|nr:DNA repair protein RadC [Rhodospirillales bacterium]MBT4040436.1 DNA repair protein RadC [Rhodospirillales bacterium]MBT4625954.1 DNA repair protein RadC [Rhodospirillales bacterium]MBT5350691.1 DNA repair protein RadC [Rhodospirillales bacterium]MBT5522053.1 DNA repair protein RadC [Rhodospirillales bacterium]
MVMKSSPNHPPVFTNHPTLIDRTGVVSEPSDYSGHRQRLRDRFLKAGGDALADYEMLELLLFQAQPRRDMKPLAKSLMKRFGTYADVISASPAELAEVDGVGDAVIAVLKTVQESAQRLIRDEIMDKPVLSNWQRLMDYCRSSMARNKIESFRVLFLNHRNELIADEQQQTGTVDHTPVYPREVIKRALELHASAMIMVHNHPSGDPAPSKADIAMTKEVRDAAEKLGISLHDHLIVSKSGNTSFKDLGIL